MATAVGGMLFAGGLIGTVINILYFTLMEASKYQATIGKLALGLKVTDMGGKKLDFTKALIRQVGKIVSGIILLIGYIMAGFTEKKQALHDMIDLYSLQMEVQSQTCKWSFWECFQTLQLQ